MRTLLWLPVALCVSACSSVSVPEMTYYRPAEAVLAPDAPRPQWTIPVDVEVFAADGLYAEQSILYALDDEARVLRGYHYQLWTDPPARMLQRRLIGLLRTAGITPMVTDRLPASVDSVRIDGVIQRYDRVPQGTGFRAAVALQLRVKRGGNLLLEKAYSVNEPASGGELGQTVDAFARGLDSIYAQFLADLATLDIGAPAVESGQ